MPHPFYTAWLFLYDFHFFLYFTYSKASHKLALKPVFAHIIVLLFYSYDDDDISQTSALPIQKHIYWSDTKAEGPSYAITGQFSNTDILLFNLCLLVHGYDFCACIVIYLQ